MTLLKALPFMLAVSVLLSETEAKADDELESGTGVRLSGEFLCRREAAKSLCPKSSHFQTLFLAEWKGEKKVVARARLGYDSNPSRKATWYDSHDLHHLDLPPQRGWLSDYGFEYAPWDHWSFAVEDFTGTTLLSDQSHLAFARNLQDIGWNQTATRMRFEMGSWTADLVAGLGEGERLATDDGLNYLGFGLKREWEEALRLALSYSYDPDSLPKDAIWWLGDKSHAKTGFQTERIAADLVLTGGLPSIRGLEASVGWQRTRITAPPSKTLPAAPLTLALDPTEIIAQNHGSTGETRREAWHASASYSILDEYSLGFHLGEFRSGFADNTLTTCAALDPGGSCLGTSHRSHGLRIREWTYGLGRPSTSRHVFGYMFEFHEERYDQLYQNYHFLTGSHDRQKSMRLVQGRLNWSL